MPNTIHGPWVPTPIIPGVTAFNAALGNHMEQQAATALASFNPDFIGNAFVLSGVVASRHNNYASNVLADSPVAYFRLGDPSGSVSARDSSGGVQSLVYNNGPTLGTGGLLTGDGDTAVTFTAASSQYASGLNAAPLPTGAGAVTLEVWMKFAANPASNQFILDIGDRSVATHTLALILTATGAVQLSNVTTAITSGVLSTGARHHLVGTYDGTNLRLYVDGTLAAGPTAATNALAYTGNTLTIGSQSGATPGAYYDGQIDEAAVYTTALSSTRVTAHWTAGTTATTQLDVTSGTAYLVQADGTVCRCDVVSTSFTTATINTTYFLDLNPDGSWSWNTFHSGLANHLTIASVATDSLGNCVTVTDLRPLTATMLPASAAPPRGVIASTSNTPVHVTTTAQTTILSVTAPVKGTYRANLSVYIGAVPATVTALVKCWSGDNPGSPASSYFSVAAAPLNAFSIATIGEQATIPQSFYAAANTPISILYTNTSGTPNDLISAVIERLT